ncbi:hypothetical protein TVAG_010620 [Trichomonas vaginalis G3]|uniref:LysM domain-containing protein n=1 Tax=Trichomonas vaginalis (strain ATCC PRA-98 / G3) TaxID=412133 RepID=A2DNY9_TRIV3|nr:LysM domain domain-containing protein [Trichomonas vaginalis G3]EAY17838.1 hypothetical protein TVAG_010620 [Trichomonas vaginalis G3]KAI5489961.1 LysM domain domain-containing protein [Trichomonas vaginalis G3]|eukprot:XP_001329973.1 hypothetical protein [Trichomonas vaginalis G3]
MFGFLFLYFSFSERCISYHTTKIGDSLLQIQKISGNTAEELFELNPNLNLQRLSPGMTIYIYTKCSTSQTNTPIFLERSDIQDLDLMSGSLFLCFLKYKGYTTVDQASHSFTDLFEKNLINMDGSIDNIFPVAQYYGFNFVYRNVPRKDTKLEIGEYVVDGNSHFCIIETIDGQISIVFNPSTKPKFRNINPKKVMNHYYCV